MRYSHLVDLIKVGVTLIIIPGMYLKYVNTNRIRDGCYSLSVHLLNQFIGYINCVLV